MAKRGKSRAKNDGTKGGWIAGHNTVALGLLVFAAAAAATLLLSPGITGYFARVVGASSVLESWSSADAQGGGAATFINEQAVFYANFTSSSTGLPITGGSTSCTATFNVSGTWTSPATMNYNASSGLYEYGRDFSTAGFYDWNATCDGTSQGYDLLEAPDNVTVLRYEWWNNSWNYRTRIDVQNGGISVDDWPVETSLNLTDVMMQVGGFGTFDDNSTRVIEYNHSTGVPLHEIPSQFDKEDGYDAAGNAVGTGVFMLNGTTGPGVKRTFYLYFGVTEGGTKAQPSYATNLSYSWAGDEIMVNTSTFSFHFDTNRSGNTSGLYQSEFKGYPVSFFTAGEDEMTVERTEYSNGTHNFSFSFYQGGRRSC